MNLLQAIAHQEGFFVIPGSPLYPTLAQRNHNPGNIVYGHFAEQHRASGVPGAYAVFPDDATGWAALRDLLSGPAYRGLTVEAAINRYCPPADGSALTAGNQPDQYVKNVCRWCDCSPQTIIDSLLD